MTLVLHRGNDLDALVDALATLPPIDPPDPFEPETIILQTRGMERWLSMRLAEKRDIFAHGRFLSFDDLLDELMTALVPTPRAEHWRPGQLLWRIAEVLRGARTDPELGALAAWLDSTHTAAGVDGALPDQILQLAQRLADVFHRYALHRPAMVDAWEAGEDAEGQAWQSALWRRLAQDIGAPHPGRRLVRLVAALADGPLPESLPRRIVLFGHHTLVPLHIDALQALGRRAEVHLFHPAIGPGVGGDEHVIKHPLRASLGRLLDHMDALLVERAPEAVRVSHLVEPRAATLLGRIQRSIYFGPSDDGRERPPLDEADRSFQLHSCASPLRQVEVLRDELLALFAAHDDLEPRDVIVMTPDIETYAPLIDAVFRDGDKELPKDVPLSAGFPPIHRLHDLSLRRTNPVAEAFLAILDLAGTRYALSSLLDLLSLPPVLAKVGLLEEELGRVSELVIAAQIRWGRDEHHRAAEGQPATRRNTWAGGFDRLLLGHALASTGVDDFLGIVPVDDVEGKDETRTVGQLIDYLERLFDQLAALRRPRSVPEWRHALSELVRALLVHDDTSAGLAQVVLDVLQEIVQRAELGGFAGELELGAMRGLLSDPLEARRPSVSFLSGGLTFCTLLPMRTIPFRVIALLGMDDGTFPRTPHGLGFDLLERRFEPGDRSTREDDRMTFLETIAAAREHLLVTWTGYRATDKRPLDAAGPVAELIESVRRALGVETLPPSVMVEHPLQPFTPRNFRSPPQSFDNRYLKGALRILGPRERPPAHWDGRLSCALPTMVPLDKLAAALSDPSRWFCRERLRIWLSERDNELADREPIRLSSLDLWNLRDRVLGWELDAIDSDDRMRALEATGVLPFGAAGRLVLRQIEDEVRAIAERVRVLRHHAWQGRPGDPPAHPDPIPVSLRLHGLDLSGQLDLVYDDRRIAYSASKLRAKAIVGLWVRHLALAAALKRPVWSHMVAQDRVATLWPIAPARARELLYRLCERYLDAHRRPLLLFPGTSMAWLEHRASLGQWPPAPGAPNAPSGDVASEARDEWKKRYEGRDIGESTDRYVALLFGDQEDDFPFGDTAFADLAEELFGPLFLTPDGRPTAHDDGPILVREEL